MVNKIHWTEEEIDILKTTYGKTSIWNNLLSRSLKSIKNKAQRLGLADKQRKYYQNDNYFNQYTIERCYWAGFIAADGNIHKNKDKVIVQLSSSDLDHLEKLKNVVNYTGPIRNYQNNFSGMSVLQISSKQMVNDLFRLFNITPKKSKTLIPPTLLLEDHIRAFIRGYFDGDGCLSSSWSVVGTEQMVQWIVKNLAIYVGTNQNQSIRQREGIFIVEYGGRLQKKRICDWLYQNSNDDIRLNRKFQKVGQ
jgi:hypothetical protein